MTRGEKPPLPVGLPAAMLAVLLAIAVPVAGENRVPAAAIPGADALSPLRREGEIERRTPESLWERINGQAELYRSYGLLGSAHAVFVDPHDEDRRVDLSVFVLGQPLEAFGLFAYFRPDDCMPVHLGNGACLGDRQAFFWLGSTFVLADASGPDAARAVDLRRALETAAGLLGTPPPLPPPLRLLSRAVPEETIRFQPRHLLGREALPPGLEGRWQGIDCFIAPGPLDVTALLARFAGTWEGVRWQDRDGLRVLSGHDPILGPVTLAGGGRFLVGARAAPETPGLLSFLASLASREEGGR